MHEYAANKKWGKFLQVLLQKMLKKKQTIVFLTIVDEVVSVEDAPSASSRKINFLLCTILFLCVNKSFKSFKPLLVLGGWSLVLFEPRIYKPRVRHHHGFLCFFFLQNALRSLNSVQCLLQFCAFDMLFWALYCDIFESLYWASYRRPPGKNFHFLLTEGWRKRWFYFFQKYFPLVSEKKKIPEVMVNANI